MTWPISWGEINDHLKNHPAGVSSWNDLTDKPVDYVGDTALTWDWLRSEVINVASRFYKVSDKNPPPFEQLASATLEYMDSLGSNVSVSFGEFGEFVVPGVYRTKYLVVVYEEGVNVPFTDPYDLEEYTFPEVGFWIVDDSEYMTKLTIPDFSFQEEKLKKELLPKAEAVADVTAAPTAEQFNALLASLRNAGYLAK